MPKIQTIKSRIIKKVYLTDKIFIMSLDANIDFKAGQFVNFKLSNGEQKRQVPYTILNPPSKNNEIDFCIELIDGGFASSILKDVKEGDEIEIVGPFGQFTFDQTDDADEFCFIGTGTGIAPLYSMIKEYLPMISNKRFRLIFGVREKKDLIFNDELIELSKKYNNFVYVPTLTREDWDGRKGRVQQHIGDDVEGKVFYICGIKEMVTETKEYLVKKGVKPNMIRFERYT